MKVWRSTFVFHCFSSGFWYAWHGNQQTHCSERSSERESSKVTLLQSLFPLGWLTWEQCRHYPGNVWLWTSSNLLFHSLLFFSIFTQDRLVLTSNGQGSGSPQVIGYDAPIAQQHPILGSNSCHTVHTLGCPTPTWVFGMYPAFSKVLTILYVTHTV